jgi:hypothetical protein
MELDQTARFRSAKAPIKEPVITTGIGGLIAAYAHQIGASLTAVVAILIVTAIAAGLAYAIARSRANA